MGHGQIVKLLTWHRRPSQFERWCSILFIVKTIILSTLLSLSLIGCDACKDNQGSPNPQTPPPPETVPLSTTAQPSGSPALVAECQVKDGIHRFALNGADIGMPTAPSDTWTPHYVTHFGGAARAVTYVASHLIWAEGSTLRSDGLSEDLKMVVNGLATFTDAGATKLAIATTRGLLIAPVAIAGDQVNLGSDRTVIDQLGEVTMVRAAAAESVQQGSPPSGLNLSLNVPPPGTATQPALPALYFTTTQGEAYRLQSHCLTQLYDPTKHQQGNYSMKAAAIAGDAQRAVILTEAMVPPVEEKAVTTGIAARTLMAAYPGATREGAHAWIPRLLHFGANNVAWQAIYSIDLVKKTVTPLFPKVTGTDDQLLNDLAVAHNHVFVQGLFFTRSPLVKFSAKEEDLWQLLANLALVIKGNAANDIPSGVLSAMKSGITTIDLDNTQGTQGFISLPPLGGAQLAPFLGQLAPAGDQLYFGGPLGYVAKIDVNAGTASIITTSGGKGGIPREIAIDQHSEQMALATSGVGRPETLPFSGGAMSSTETAGRPHRLLGVYNHLLLCADAAGTTYQLIDTENSSQTAMSNPAVTLTKNNPKPTTITSHHIRATALGGKTYLVHANSIWDPGKKLHSGLLMLFASDNLPSPATPDNQAIAELVSKYKAPMAFVLNAELGGGLFFDGTIKTDINPRIADMRVEDQTIILLLAGEDANTHYYRIALYRIVEKDGKLSVQSGGLSKILALQKASEHIAAPAITYASASQTIGSGAVIADVATPEGLLEFKLVWFFPITGSNFGVLSKIPTLAAARIGDAKNVVITPEATHVFEYTKEMLQDQVTDLKSLDWKESVLAEAATAVVGSTAVIAYYSTLLEGGIRLLQNLDDPSKATLTEPIAPHGLLNLFLGSDGNVVGTSDENGIVIYKF